jgi:hypothetical protein
MNEERSEWGTTEGRLPIASEVWHTGPPAPGDAHLEEAAAFCPGVNGREGALPQYLPMASCRMPQATGSRIPTVTIPRRRHPTTIT